MREGPALAGHQTLGGSKTVGVKKEKKPDGGRLEETTTSPRAGFIRSWVGALYRCDMIMQETERE